MRYPILLITAFAVLASSARAQLAQPPAGVAEGLQKELMNAFPANPELANLEASPVWVRLGGSQQRPLSNESRRWPHIDRCTQTQAQMGLWASWRQEHVFPALGDIRQSLRRE